MINYVFAVIRKHRFSLYSLFLLLTLSQLSIYLCTLSALSLCFLFDFLLFCFFLYIFSPLFSTVYPFSALFFSVYLLTRTWPWRMSDLVCIINICPSNFKLISTRSDKCIIFWITINSQSINVTLRLENTCLCIWDPIQEPNV